MPPRKAAVVMDVDEDAVLEMAFSGLLETRRIFGGRWVRPVVVSRLGIRSVGQLE
jgi:hypothetical protein